MRSARRRLISTTWSSGSSRLTVTSMSMNRMLPTARARTRSAETTPGVVSASSRTRAGAPSEPEAGHDNDGRQGERRDRVGPRVAEPDAREAGQDRGRAEQVRAEMQRVRLERLAAGLPGGPFQRAHAPDVDADGQDHDGEHPDVRLHPGGRAEQTADGFEPD